MDSIANLIAQLPAWIHVATLVIAAASAIVALTPTPRDDEFVGKAYKVIEWLALNFGKAKDQPPNKQ